ncbi:hypothetical protein ACN47E_009640 [Coniothyrium glycines]
MIGVNKAQGAMGAQILTPPADGPTSTENINPVTSLKRARTDPAAGEQDSKKTRASPPTALSQNQQATQDMETTETAVDSLQQTEAPWQGFCQIESDPAYFSVILREMGVRGVTVREVFTVDPDYIQETLPQPIYGLILLFHYREFGTADQPDACPKNVWFANQLPAQDSCATLAMINILMNSDNTEVDIGEHLSQFKDFTSDFTPFQRGEALDSFEFVKRIHNSFAKTMDILESDKHLSYKVKKSRNNEPEEIVKNHGTKRRRAAREATAATDDSADNYEENGHHFIAFVPVGTEVWKLDGMDKQPTSMGSFNPAKGETWLTTAGTTIATLMAAGDDDYSVIALTHSPLPSLQKDAATMLTTLHHLETRLTALTPDWRAFTPTDEAPPTPSSLGIPPETYLTHPAPDNNSTLAPVSPSPPTPTLQDLLPARSTLVKNLTHTALGILTELHAEAEQDHKAAQRRFDCGPLIKRWLEMLARNGHLERELPRFMPGAAKRGEGGERRRHGHVK